MQRVSLVSLCALAACAVAPVEPADEPETGEATSPVAGVDCDAFPGPVVTICNGGGTAYSASLRVGATETVSAELIQTFTATSETKDPVAVRLGLRVLRRFVGEPYVHVAIRPVGPGNTVPEDSSQDLAFGDRYLSELGAGDPGHIVLSRNGTLLNEGETYALVVSLSLPEGSPSGLAGVASYPGDTFGNGTSWRRVFRNGTSALREASGDLSFAIAFNVDAPPPPQPMPYVCVSNTSDGIVYALWNSPPSAGGVGARVGRSRVPHGWQLAFDRIHNELYLPELDPQTGYMRIHVVDPGAVPGAPPLRTIALGEGDFYEVEYNEARHELFVPWWDNDLGQTVLLVFPRGTTTPSRRIVTPGFSIQTFAVDGGRDEIFLAGDRGAGTEVVVADVTVDGTWVELRSLQGVPEPFRPTAFEGVTDLTFDAAHDELIASRHLPELASVLVYGRLAVDDAPAVRRLDWTPTGENAPSQVAIDEATSDYYVLLFDGRVQVQPRTATGNPAPLREFSWLPLASYNATLAFGNGSVVYAGAEGQTVVTFPRTSVGAIVGAELPVISAAALAPGRAVVAGSRMATPVPAQNAIEFASYYATSLVIAPYAVLQGPLTQLDAPRVVAWDRTHSELLTLSAAPAILTFDDTAEGDVAPTRVVQGPATQLQQPVSVANDETRDEVYVADETAARVFVYARLASGNVAPLRSFGHPGLTRPGVVEVDRVHGELFVLDLDDAQVWVFDRTADGAVVIPLRVLELDLSSSTGVSQIAVDPGADLIYALHGLTNEVSVWNRTDTGSATPLRTFTNAALEGPVGLSMCPGPPA